MASRPKFEFPDEEDIIESKIGFYYTPNSHHVHLAISIILNNGEHIYLLPDGTRIDQSEFYFAPISEINDYSFGKLFHEFTYFPLHLREMPDALAQQIEKVIIERYFRKSPKKIKQEKSSSSDGETFKSPNKKRVKKMYTPSPKSSPEPCGFSPCKKKSKIIHVSPKITVIKKKSRKIGGDVGNISFRDLSHMAEGFFGNRNLQENIDSSDEDEIPCPIDMYRRLGEEIGESSRAMDGTTVVNDDSSFQDRDGDKKKQSNRWQRIIDPETSSEEESSMTPTVRKNDQHRCREHKCTFKSGNSSGSLRQHMMEVHLEGSGVLCGCGLFCGSLRNFRRHLKFVTKRDMRSFSRFIRQLKDKGIISQEYTFEHDKFVEIEMRGYSPFGNRIRLNRTIYEAAFRHNSHLIERAQRYVINSPNQQSTADYFGA